MKHVVKIFLISYLICAQQTFAQTFEAEDATLTGGAFIENNDSVSGGKYVAQKDGTLTFNITLDEEAYFDIYVNAASPSGKKTNIFSLEEGDIEFTFQQNSDYISQKVVSYLRLSAGSHTLKIKKSWGWINIDYILFETVDPSNRFNINKNLVTTNPTDHTTKLYQFLYDNYGKKIISGVMTLNSMDEVNWLKTKTGKAPALVGIDFLHSGRGYSWYNDKQPIIDAKNYYNKNGIPALCWHWRDPSRKTNAFYTEDTDFDVSKISDTTSAEYAAIVNDIDYISGLLKELQDDDIPVLWRPLHEASGGWFWWGAKGAEPCKALYRLMFDRMVNYHGLRNLIWVWTTQQNDMDWYPGDEYVDIVGRDIYKEGDHNSQILEFNMLNNDYDGKKIITLSECGSFPDADNLVKDEAPWSYFMPWYGDFVEDSKYNSLELWKKNFDHDYVITLDEMPDLKNYTTPAASSWRSELYPEDWNPGYSDKQGRFLHDFSYAGYHQGEKEIPIIEDNIIDVTQAPYNADNSGETDVTLLIQQALDDAGQTGGGVVYLPSGTYLVNPGDEETALRIKYDNVILRGAGTDSTFIYNGTSLMRQKSIIWLMGDWCTWSKENGTPVLLNDDLLYPTRIIPVESVNGYQTGDDIILRTDGTEAFIEEHDMAGIWEDWAARVMFLRKIDSVDTKNNLIYIDSPTRYFMKKRDNARIYKAKKHITECGIENLSIGNLQSDKSGWDEESYSTEGTGAYDVHFSQAILVKYAQNCWIKKVNTYHPAANTDDFHLLSNGILLDQCRDVTIDSCFFQKPQYEGGGGNGYMFTLSSNDCLVENCRANDSRHNYDFKYPYSNGNVIYNCIGENSKYSSDFHMYLSMANLIDNFTVDKDYLESTFRPYGGTVIHGYSSTQSAFYNTKGLAYHSNKEYVIESRQFGYGYVIGTSGEAYKVLLDPVQGSSNGYSYNTSPRDFSEGIGTGESLYPQSLYLDQLGKRMHDSTGLPKYNVSINVIHSETKEPLENCSVTIMNAQEYTDHTGEAIFDSINSLLIVDLDKEGFYSQSNKQYMIYSDTTLTFQLVPQEFSVTIALHDKNTGETFKGVPVTFNNVKEVTNDLGETYFTAYQGTFDYYIDKLSYENMGGTVEVKSDTTFHFYLIRSNAYTKFKLTEENSTTPVNNANIILNNDTLITNGLGIATFKDLPIDSEYSYLVYKEGYYNISGSLFLQTDTVLNFGMIKVPTSAVVLRDYEFNFWPNPVYEEIFIQLPENFKKANIKIIDITGSTLKIVQVKSSSKLKLLLNDLSPGIYVLRIDANENQINRTFIKK